MPGDKPRSGDKPELERQTAQKGDATLKKPQIVYPTGGGTGNYQGGESPSGHEPGDAGDYTQDSGASDQATTSTHQEDRPKLPDKPSDGGASQLNRATSL